MIDGWKTSTFSNGNANCVEARWAATTVDVRDGKQRDGGYLSWTSSAWRSLLATLR